MVSGNDCPKNSGRAVPLIDTNMEVCKAARLKTARMAQKILVYGKLDFRRNIRLYISLDTGVVCAKQSRSSSDFFRGIVLPLT